MTLKICSYNVEWMDELFDKNGALIASGDEKERADALALVLQNIDADLVGLMEGPITHEGKDTVQCLQTFAAAYGLRTTKAIRGYKSTGFPKDGKYLGQEMAILFDPNKVQAKWTPEETGKKISVPPKKFTPFKSKFEYDTDDDRVKEIYALFRKPLEAEITVKNGQGVKKFNLLLVHTKSKGIFSAHDLYHREKENMRNRHKLVAECTWVRSRVDLWLDNGKPVVVMGDFNDGPGMDFYEFKLGKSAVEIVMGNAFEPSRILQNFCGRPTYKKGAWSPYSTSFTDKLFGGTLKVLIDHILVSQDIPVKGVDGQHTIWNPDTVPRSQKDLRKALGKASDHYPVSLELEVG